jgi:fructose-1,6-bisphosphatase/inositol monophosphatase family enzyme
MAERGKPNPKEQGIEYKEALEIMDQLALVVRSAGEEIVGYKGSVVDIGVFHSHEMSTIDPFARSRVIHYLDFLLPNIEGARRFELLPYDMTLIQDEGEVKGIKRYYLIIDELDGTTNTKRVLASGFNYRPQAAVSIALSLSEGLGDLQIAALYDIHDQETYTAMKMGNYFLSYLGASQIRPKEIEKVKGDTAERILIVGYSNTRRIEKAQFEEVLVKQGKFRVYDGCRASSIDVLNVIRGLYDAYVDPRAIWGRKSGAVLEPYDIAAAVPIALGCGLVVSDISGESWQNYKSHDPIPLIIARPSIHDKIIEIVKPLVEQYRSA